MDFVHIELPIHTAADLKEPEIYRIYAGSDLLVERSTHWDYNNYFVNEQIVVKKVPTILIRIESTCKNYELALVDTPIPRIIDIPYVKLNQNTIYPKIIRSTMGRNKFFSLVNIIYLTV